MTSGFAFNQTFDSDDEEATEHTVAGRDATIFIIDSSTSMFENFEEFEETTCLFSKCLTVLERLMLNKIISSKDLVSLLNRFIVVH